MSVPPSYPPSPPASPPPSAPLAPPVPTYLAWAILATVASVLFCCLVGTIPGIVAIVFATQVNRRWDAGDEAGALRASRNAKLWCWITTGLCIAGLLSSIWFIQSGSMAEYHRLLEELEQAHWLQK